MDMTNFMNLMNKTISQIAEVAGYLWQKGWAERNGGNLVVRLTDSRYFVKATGSRMRNLAKDPMGEGLIIELTDDEGHYSIVDNPHSLQPTSELPSHLAIHRMLLSRGGVYRASLHTHPTALIALTHCPQLLDAPALTHTLWSMIPEARIFCPKGLEIVPYAEPGSNALAEGTLQALEHHDLALWEKHGAIAIGPDIIEAFDTIDVMDKAAQIYLQQKALNNALGTQGRV